MDIEFMPVSELSENPYNSKLHTPEQIEGLKKSILKFGWTQPLVVDEDGMVLVGHGRLRAASEIGMKKVPAVRMSKLSVTDKLALNITDNKLNHETGFDQSKLNFLMKGLEEAEFPMPDFGMMFPEPPGDESYEVPNQVDRDNESIRTLGITFTTAEFETVVSKFQQILTKEPQLKDDTMVFLKLIEEYGKA